MHGTGSEDYFSQGWEMQAGNAYHFNGSIVHESAVASQQVSYRFHLADPIRFKRKIRVTMEHGHGNHLSNDWSSTAYWYQTLPGPKLSILPVQGRLPRRADIPQPAQDPSPKTVQDPEKQEMIKRAEQRYQSALRDLQRLAAIRSRESRDRASKNIERAKEVRKRWMENGA